MAEYVPVINLSKYVETRYFGERPHLKGRRIPIATLAYAARDNQHDVEQLMAGFDLTEAEVLAALLYYVDHRAELDAQEAAYAIIDSSEHPY